MQFFKGNRANPLKYAMIALVVFFGIQLISDFFSNFLPSLKEFSFKEEKFSAKFFSQPQVNPVNFDFQDYKLTGKHFLSQASSFTLVVVYFNLTEEILSELTFEEIVDLFIKSQQLTLKQDNPVTKIDISNESNQAYEIQYETKEGLLTQYYYLHQERIYNVVGLGPQDAEKDIPFIKDFIDSFQLLD